MQTKRETRLVLKGGQVKLPGPHGRAHRWTHPDLAARVGRTAVVRFDRATVEDAQDGPVAELDGTTYPLARVVR
jgi:hypothetical protein